MNYNWSHVTFVDARRWWLPVTESLEPEEL